METGLISKIVDGEGFYVFVPFPATHKIEKQGITEVYVEVSDPRIRSEGQRKKVFGLIL